MLNERTSSKFADMLEKLAQPANTDPKFPRKPTTTNNLGGTQCVNIVCQTLVIGSIQELVDATKAQND